jgi:SpoVK/Ycf46/Vps4 family AAA+-type ATPase
MHGSKTLKQVEGALLSEVSYPSAYWQQQYDGLVGLDQIKARVLKMLLTLFSPDIAVKWCRKHHPHAAVADLLSERYPLFTFVGSPGVGKTVLARSIGHPLARALGTPVVAYSVGLQIRGDGLVGQLSKNITTLIDFARGKHQESGLPILLHVDEADAIGQSREIKEQHHEDSAGVNTLLQQIDTLRDTPGVALILTTNRPGALDVALRKRSSAHCISFPLPSFSARRELLRRKFGTLLNARDLQTLVGATDGFAPRDIVEMGNSAVLEAIMRDAPLTTDLLLRATRSLGHAQPLPSGTSSAVTREGQSPEDSGVAAGILPGQNGHPVVKEDNRDTSGSNTRVGDPSPAAGTPRKRRSLFHWPIAYWQEHQIDAPK